MAESATPGSTPRGHVWVPCKVFDGSCSRHRCGLDCEHLHCRTCGLVSFPSVDNPVQREYLAWENPNTRTREYEPVPSECPLPAHLRPYRVKRAKVEPGTKKKTNVP